MAHLEIDENVGHGLDEPTQAGEFFEFDMGAVNTETFQRFAEVIEILCGKRFVEKQQLAELFNRFQCRHNLQHISHKLHIFHRFSPLRTQAVFQN